MKNLIFKLIALGVISSTAISCQGDRKSVDTKDSLSVSTTKDSTQAQNAPSTPKQSLSLPVSKGEIEKAEVSQPDFSNEDVNKGFNEFKEIKSAYQNALKNKDAAAIESAKSRYLAWANNAVTWGRLLQPEENQEHIDYYQKLVRQWEIVERQAKYK